MLTLLEWKDVLLWKFYIELQVYVFSSLNWTQVYDHFSFPKALLY